MIPPADDKTDGLIFWQTAQEILKGIRLGKGNAVQTLNDISGQKTFLLGIAACIH